MVEGFIDDMVLETSHTDAATVVEDNNETTTVSKSGKAIIPQVADLKSGVPIIIRTTLEQ